MSRERDARVYLEDIVDAARKAQQFTAGLTFEQFEADEKSVYAGQAHPCLRGSRPRGCPAPPHEEWPAVMDDVQALLRDLEGDRGFRTC